MNLMNSNLSITDGVYGVLSTAEVGQHIAGLGRQVEVGLLSQNDVADQLLRLVLQFKEGRAY
jgi:hypothetical protein